MSILGSVADMDNAQFGLRLTADRDGECSACGDDILAGCETYTDGEGGYLCQHCGIPAGGMQRRLITVTPPAGAPVTFVGTEFRHGEGGSVFVLDDAKMVASFAAGEWERIAIDYAPPDGAELQPARGTGGDPCGQSSQGRTCAL
jgi:hypothetical protein